MKSPSLFVLTLVAATVLVSVQGMVYTAGGGKGPTDQKCCKRFQGTQCGQRIETKNSFPKGCIAFSTPGGGSKYLLNNGGTTDLPTKPWAGKRLATSPEPATTGAFKDGDQEILNFLAKSPLSYIYKSTDIEIACLQEGVEEMEKYCGKPNPKAKAKPKPKPKANDDDDDDDDDISAEPKPKPKAKPKAKAAALLQAKATLKAKSKIKAKPTSAKGVDGKGKLDTPRFLR